MIDKSSIHRRTGRTRWTLAVMGGALAANLAMQPAFAVTKDVLIDDFDNDEMEISISADVEGVGNPKILVGSTNVTGIMGDNGTQPGQRIGAATILASTNGAVPRGVDVDWGFAGGVWSTSIGNTISGKVDVYWDGNGQNSDKYPDGECTGVGLGADWSTATAVNVTQVTGDLNGTIRLKIQSWDGSNGTAAEAEKDTLAGAQTYVFDADDLAAIVADGVDLSSVCQVEVEIQSKDVGGDFAALDTGIDKVTVTMETPELRCTSQSFADNSESADKTVRFSAVDIPDTQSCTDFTFTEAVSCDGLSLDATTPIVKPDNCTGMTDNSDGTWTFTGCGDLTNGTPAATYSFTVNNAGDQGSCEATLTAFNCTLPGAQKELGNCNDSFERDIPEIVPAISPLGLGFALLALPLGGGFLARRRRNSKR